MIFEDMCPNIMSIISTMRPSPGTVELRESLLTALVPGPGPRCSVRRVALLTIKIRADIPAVAGQRSSVSGRAIARSRNNLAIFTHILADTTYFGRENK